MYVFPRGTKLNTHLNCLKRIFFHNYVHHEIVSCYVRNVMGKEKIFFQNRRDCKSLPKAAALNPHCNMNNFSHVASSDIAGVSVRSIKHPCNCPRIYGRHKMAGVYSSCITRLFFYVFFL